MIRLTHDELEGLTVSLGRISREALALQRHDRSDVRSAGDSMHMVALTIVDMLEAKRLLALKDIARGRDTPLRSD